MPSAGTIASPRNQRVVRARALKQHRHRKRERRFLVEGLQLLHMGLEAGVEPLAVFYCEELFTGAGAPELLARCRRTRAELVPVSVRVMESLSDRDAPQGAIGVFPFVEISPAALRVTAEELVLVLDRLQNPGNLGSLLRTADATGAAAVFLLEPCVDPYDPAAVRGSMGSLFSVPLVRVEDPESLFSWLGERNLRPIGADPYQGNLWYREEWRGGTALVLGNEARGLSADVRPHVERWARLPMTGRAESLNVAVVGGVLMYAWVQANPARWPARLMGPGETGYITGPGDARGEKLG